MIRYLCLVGIEDLHMLQADLDKVVEAEIIPLLEEQTVG